MNELERKAIAISKERTELNTTEWHPINNDEDQEDKKSPYLVEARYLLADYYSIPYDLNMVHEWWIRNQILYIRVTNDKTKAILDFRPDYEDHDAFKHPEAESVTQGNLTKDGQYLFGEYLVMK